MSGPEKVELAYAEAELERVASLFRRANADFLDEEELKAAARRFVRAEDAVKARTDLSDGKSNFAVGSMPTLDVRCTCEKPSGEFRCLNCGELLPKSFRCADGSDMVGCCGLPADHAGKCR